MTRFSSSFAFLPQQIPACYEKHIEDSQMPPIYRLPNEILLAIGDMCFNASEEQPNFEGLLSQYLETRDAPWENEENPALHTLRLVSQRFATLFTPKLFERVVLLHHTKSWANLNAIANSRLALLVKMIAVATNEDVPYYAGEDYWKNNVMYAVKEVHVPFSTAPLHSIAQILQRLNTTSEIEHSQISHRKEGLQWTNVAAGGPVSRVDLSTSEKGFARYRYWEQGEAAMRQHAENGTAPPLRLDLFTNLTEVMTVKDHLQHVRVNPDASIYNELQRCGCTYTYRASRRAIETGTWDSHGIQWANVQTLFHAAHLSGVCIKYMTITSCLELQQASISIEGLRFPSLKKLWLDIHWAAWISADQSVTSWLSTLENLQELVVATGVIRNDDRITFETLDLLKTVFCPKLEILDVWKTKVSFKTLDHFVQVHAATLRYLKVEYPRMSRNEWAEFRSKYVKMEGMKNDLSWERLEVVELADSNGPLDVECRLYDGDEFVGTLSAF